MKPTYKARSDPTGEEDVGTFGIVEGFGVERGELMIEELSVWDLPDTKMERDGYDMKTVPDISAENIRVIMEKVKEVVREVNRLSRRSDAYIEEG